MTSNHDPQQLNEILAGYVLGNLDEVELAWLNEQLAVNPQLREKIKQLEATLTLIPYSLPENIPNSYLRDKILAKARPRVDRSHNFNRLGWIVSAVTALTTLWLGINNQGLRQQLANTNNQLQQHQELIVLLRQPNNRLVSFKGLDKLPNASGSLFIVPEENKAILALQNLEPLSGKQVYRLWAVSQGKTTGCANFTPDEKGTIHLKLSNDALNDANSLLVTVEPKANTAQPQGNPILTGSYSL